MAILPTLSQATASIPTPTAPKPTIAPTIECVVDTGQPKFDAIISQVPAAKSDANIPYTNKCGLSVKIAASRIPLRMVAVTSPPARIAPANSKIMAIMIACLMVIAPEPTEVPMAFATSFAPTPQAINKPNTTAKTNNTSPYCAIISIRSPYLASSTSNREPTF